MLQFPYGIHCTGCEFGRERCKMEIIRPILEYACPAWHNSLTNEQSRQIESVQKRALSIIIFGYTWGHYDQLCSDEQLPTLHNRRTELSKSFLISLFWIRTVAYIICYPFHVVVLLINSDPAYSISRKQQKLPDFNILFKSTPLTITKLNLSPIVPALFVLLLCSIVFYCDID